MTRKCINCGTDQRMYNADFCEVCAAHVMRRLREDMSYFSPEELDLINDTLEESYERIERLHLIQHAQKGVLHT